MVPPCSLQRGPTPHRERSTVPDLVVFFFGLKELCPAFTLHGLVKTRYSHGVSPTHGVTAEPVGRLNLCSPKSCRCLGLLDPEPDSGPFRDLVGVLIELFTGCYLGS